LSDILRFSECPDTLASHQASVQTTVTDAAKHEFLAIPDKNTSWPAKEMALLGGGEVQHQERQSRHKSTLQLRKKNYSVGQSLALSPCLFLVIGLWAYMVGGF
tara:strand:- start:412 stop:720 length:309 start_codon:yes stop_codon:yes gene_type:complete